MPEAASSLLVLNTEEVLFRVSRRLGISAFEVELAYPGSHFDTSREEFKIGLEVFSSCIQQYCSIPPACASSRLQISSGNVHPSVTYHTAFHARLTTLSTCEGLCSLCSSFMLDR